MLAPDVDLDPGGAVLIKLPRHPPRLAENLACLACHVAQLAIDGNQLPVNAEQRKKQKPELPVLHGH